MLNAKMIKSLVSKTSEIKEVYVKILDTKAYVKKLARKDSSDLVTHDDAVATMVMAGVVDEEGERIFESVEEVSNISNAIVVELFTHVNDYNTESVEKQAKK